MAVSAVVVAVVTVVVVVVPVVMAVVTVIRSISRLTTTPWSRGKTRQYQPVPALTAKKRAASD